jgi:hypothetical protein
MALRDARFGLLRITAHDRIVVVPKRTIVSAHQEQTMIASRREFVASIATVPFLSSVATAQPRAVPRAPDVVLDQILSDLRALSADIETQPQSRKATMRAMESTLSVGAAHLAANYDNAFLSGLRRRQARQGRAALVQDIVTHPLNQKNQNVSHDVVDAAMTRLERRGLSGCFRDVEQTIRKVRLQAPDQIQAAASRVVQYDYCSDLQWMIQMLEGIVQIACAIAILEPTVGGEVACGAISLVLGMLLVQRALFC